MRERSATLGLAPALPGIILVVVIAWALAAVLMLTGTLINAREINDAVPLILNEVQPINEDLENVELAAETVRLTAQIREAAAPLNDQADRIIAEAGSIDRHAAGILSTAGAINDTAKSINGTVLSINDTVSAISSNVVSIHDKVDSIGANVASIGSSVRSIGASVASVGRDVGAPGATNDGSIKASVDSILGTFVRLEPETRSIEEGVQAINGRADVAIQGAAAIKGDFEGIFAIVGSETGEGHSTAGPGTIHGHANSIDCSPLITSMGPTEYCGR